MMQWLALIVALLVFTPEPASSQAFRGNRGAGGGIRSQGHFGSASKIGPNFGKSRHSFSRPRIVVPHPPAASFHSRRRSFGRFTAPPKVLRQVHPPFLYHYPHHYRPFVGSTFPTHRGVLIIEVPARSGSAAATTVTPDPAVQPFAPAPLLEGYAVRTLPEQLAPFDPTPQEVVDRMLALAGVKNSDVVYDLGSGDGRMVIAAAKEYGARAVGFEVDPGLVKLSREKIKQEKLEELVEIRRQNFMTADLSPATVVTLYLSQDGNQALKRILMRQLQPGARVVSYTFDMGDWPPKIAESYRDAA
ncbi:MAG: methyltransferase domain-containing protein, partial [Deltaproteobacteria bacterium]|nr:methyltransferase domain-containing protein [Deltaproteobacteria bacterium]